MASILDRLTPTLVRRLVDLALLVLVTTVAAVVIVSLAGPPLGFRPLVIRGASMEPAIARGSLVLAAEGAPDAPVVGDVVSFREANGVIVTHRVVSIEGRGADASLITKGDANPSMDPATIPASRVIGRVVLAIPFLGFVSAMLGMPSGLLAIVMLALGLAITSVLVIEFDRWTCPVCDAPTRDDSTAEAGERAPLAGSGDAEAVA